MIKCMYSDFSDYGFKGSKRGFKYPKTQTSEFWLKNCYLVKSPGRLLMLRGGSNLVCVLSKALITVFYEVIDLTLF